MNWGKPMVTSRARRHCVPCEESWLEAYLQRCPDCGADGERGELRMGGVPPGRSLRTRLAGTLDERESPDAKGDVEAQVTE